MNEDTWINKIHHLEAWRGLRLLPDDYVDCIVTSPPYWALRDYGIADQLGLEKTIKEYITNMAAIFIEAKRVLKPAGTCWINMGDTYSGANAGSRWNTGKDTLPLSGGKQKLLELAKGSTPKKFDHIISPKSLCMVPERLAIKLTENKWILRNQIIWHKPNCMPSSVKDRFTVDFEKIFFFVKNKKYYFNQQFEPFNKKECAYREKLRKSKEYNLKEPYKNNFPVPTTKTPGRNKRSIWKIPTEKFPEAHFATYPKKLVKECLQAGCPKKGIVLDPFMGSGTTALVAKQLGMNFVGFELNENYINIANGRLENGR